MGALRVKMKERKVLTEELATLVTPVSEKAWLPGLRLGKLSSSSFSPTPPPKTPSTTPAHPSLPLSPVPAQWEADWAKLSQASRTNICEKKCCRLTPGRWLKHSSPAFCKWALDICVSAQRSGVSQTGPVSTKLIYKLPARRRWTNFFESDF